MTPLEIAANLFNVASVYLAARNRVATWPLGIVGCCLYAVMFYRARLYADVTLQGFFVMTSLYGWRHWRTGGEGATALPLRRLQRSRMLIYVVAAAALTVGYGWALHAWTQASFPFLDSVILSFSILAQLLLMSRFVENWYAWMLVNVVAVPVYASKDLWLTSAVYAVFLVNAVIGLRAWSSELKSIEAAQDAA